MPQRKVLWHPFCFITLKKRGPVPRSFKALTRWGTGPRYFNALLCGGVFSMVRESLRRLGVDVG
jgi:hypothetical protein